MSLLDTPIEYLKGVGPVRGDMLRKELSIFTYKDLLEHFPLRHIDKTQISPIAAINFQTDFIQVKGVLRSLVLLGENRARRLVGQLFDGSGMLEEALERELKDRERKDTLDILNAIETNNIIGFDLKEKYTYRIRVELKGIRNSIFKRESIELIELLNK